MFSNKFNSKSDSLVDAVRQAQRDGDMRRRAEAMVNEQFGVYSRNAVIRENLAAYDSAVADTYATLKEGNATPANLSEETQIDEISKELAGKYIKHADYKRSDSSFQSGKVYGKELATKRRTKQDVEDARKHNRDSFKREKGINTAVNKLTGKAKVAATDKPEPKKMEEARKVIDRIRARRMEEETNLQELSAFGQAFRNAGGKNFSFNGKSYSGARSDGKSATTAAATNPGTQGVATGKSFSAIDRAQTAASKSGPADNPGLRGSTMPKTSGIVARDTGITGKPGGETGVTSGSTVSLDRAGNVGASPNAAPAPAPKPAVTPTAPVSTPTGAKSTTSSGLVGPDAGKMATPTRPTPSAPVTTQSGAPKDDASASVKKLMNMKESVQVGSNKYRIV